MKNLGVYDKINGIVIGNNFGFEGNGFLAEDVVADITKNYDFPILKINEFGHYQPHMFLPIGAKAKMDATRREIEISEDIVKMT